MAIFEFFLAVMSEKYQILTMNSAVKLSLYIYRYGQKILTFNERMQKQYLAVEKALRDEYLHSRSNFNAEHQTRLRKALAINDCLSLANTTLLTPEIHQKHYKSLSKRFLTHQKKVSKDQIRFLTILDSVAPIHSDDIGNAINVMESKIHQVVSESKTVWLLGVFEVEVVSMKFMWQSRQRDKTGKDFRKLEVCETLAKNIKKKVDRDADSLLLIHFHGIVTAHSQERLIEFQNQLNQVPAWSRAKRQIDMKSLSEVHGGRRKSVIENLRDIANYITKGGNDWVGKKLSLRYKISFDKDDPSEEAWISKNWRGNDATEEEWQEHGIADPLSLTRHEIATQAFIIDQIMSRKYGRKGYLIFSKSGQHAQNQYHKYLKLASKNTSFSTLSIV